MEKQPIKNKGNKNPEVSKRKKFKKNENQKDKKKTEDKSSVFKAVPRGLEPRTKRLTVACSTN